MRFRFAALSFALAFLSCAAAAAEVNATALDNCMCSCGCTKAGFVCVDEICVLRESPFDQGDACFCGMVNGAEARVRKPLADACVAACLEKWKYAECDDGVCAPGFEDCESCPNDCTCQDGAQACDPGAEGSDLKGCLSTRGGRCGDGACGLLEDHSVCPRDCPVCGDGVCDSPAEDYTSCPADCPSPTPVGAPPATPVPDGEFGAATPAPATPAPAKGGGWCGTGAIILSAGALLAALGAGQLFARRS